MSRRQLSIFVGAVASLAIFATVAMANVLNSASAMVNCVGYTLTVNASDLAPGTTYTINYSFSETCSGMSNVVVPGPITFMATDTTATETATGNWNLSTNCSVTGSATLTSSGSTVTVTFNGTSNTSAALACTPLTLACAASTGQEGVLYSSSLVASGGVPPYTFSITSGSLPTGLMLDASSGAITGTPTAAGSFNFISMVVDSSGNPATNTVTGSCGITISPSGPPAVCSSGASSSLFTNLGSAGPNNFAVLSLGGTGALVNINLATVLGNVGVPNFGIIKESAPSAVTGELIVGSAVNTNGAIGSHGQIVVNDSLLATAVQDAKSAATYFASLPSTPSVQAQFPANGQITGNLTVTGTVGLNVVDLSSFTLNNGSNSLTLTGPAGAEFVINDSGNFNLHTGNIQVGGGVGPLDVVYNITNPNATVTTMVPTTGVGILLAPNNTINSMDSASFTGEMIGAFGKTITLMSGSHFTNPCQQLVGAQQ